MVRSFAHGSPIIYVKATWLYADTMEPIASNQRPCVECGRHATSDGHDGCLGELIGVVNACCGHGLKSETYVQFLGAEVVRGEDAVFVLETLKRQQEEEEGNERDR